MVPEVEDESNVVCFTAIHLEGQVMIKIELSPEGTGSKMTVKCEN